MTSKYVVSLLVCFAASAAFAKPAAEPALPKIESTGISEFDSVFMKAKAIHETLDTQDSALKEARKGANKAIGVAEDASTATALTALKNAAAGKIAVDTSGATPRLHATEGASAEVQNGCEAFNKLLDAGEKTLASAKEIKPEATALATSAAAFPGKLPGMGLDPMALMKATKPVTNDAKATAATPERVGRLIQSCESLFSDLAAAFSG